jgi:hypothetical protein
MEKLRLFNVPRIAYASPVGGGRSVLARDPGAREH